MLSLLTNWEYFRYCISENNNPIVPLTNKTHIQYIFYLNNNFQDLDYCQKKLYVFFTKKVKTSQKGKSVNNRNFI